MNSSMPQSAGRNFAIVIVAVGAVAFCCWQLMAFIGPVSRQQAMSPDQMRSVLEIQAERDKKAFEEMKKKSGQTSSTASN